MDDVVTHISGGVGPVVVAASRGARGVPVSIRRRGSACAPPKCAAWPGRPPRRGRRSGPGSRVARRALRAMALRAVSRGRRAVPAPIGARIRRSGGNLYVLHQRELDDEQIGWWERVRIVTAGMAIEQCIGTGVPTSLIKQALDAASPRAAVRAGDLDRLSSTLQARNE